MLKQSCVIFIMVISLTSQVKLQRKLTELLDHKLENLENLGSIVDDFFLNNKVDDMRLRTTPDKLIGEYGYKSENHTVQTVDGYILTMHRIAGKKSSPNPNGKPAVLLQHGLLCSSMDWIITGPNRSLAFMLVDRGYDVWLGNSRGNQYSRAHVTLSPDEEKFWDFSWHEMGKYDLPVVIDRILAVTGNKNLTYIGHSQGTTMSYVLLSEHSDYNNKISKLISLAPVVFGCPASPVVQFLAPFSTVMNPILNFLGIYEFKSFNEKIKTFLLYFCNEKIPTNNLCKSVIFLVGGISEELYDKDLYPIILQYFPAGSSFKQIAHFAQTTKSGTFQQFDYRPQLNMKKYGSVDPPDYKIKNIQTPTTLFVGEHDLLAAVKEAKKFYKILPNPNGLNVVPHPTFNHFDFLWGKGVERLLYKDVISAITSSHN